MQAFVLICAVACLTALAQCQEDMITLSATIQQAIVKQHNDMRTKVAKGEEGVQPAAANMQKLEWDEHAANEAKTSAKSNAYNCASYEMYKPYMAGGTSASLQKDKPVSTEAEVQALVKAIIDEWYGEVNKPTPYSLAAVVDKNDGRRNYRQIVWAPSTKIGCAMAKVLNCDKPGAYVLFHCIYFEAGNIVGAQPYESPKYQPPANCFKGTKREGDSVLCSGTICKDMLHAQPEEKACKAFRDDCVSSVPEKKAFANKYCPATCELCGAAKTGCDNWGLTGADCSTKINECMWDKKVFDNCKKTCNQCPPGPVPCADRFSNCGSFECNTDFNKKNCPKKCGTCKTTFQGE